MHRSCVIVAGMTARRHNTGFTLVEISVVLVIVALVAGGIVIGRELLRAAELKSVISDIGRIQTAINSFKTKYSYLPGDFPKAEKYWGSDTSCPSSADDDAVPKTVTCNGDGNNRLNSPGWAECGVLASGYQQEAYRLWQHLSNAGLFPGLYNGVNGPGSVRHGILGTNIPRGSKLDNVGYQMMNFEGTMPAEGGGQSGHVWENQYNHVLFIGMEDKTNNCREPNEPFLSAAEAHDFDAKIDDGKPSEGKLVSYRIAIHPTCANGDAPGMDINYSGNTDARGCAFIYKLSWW